MEIENIARQLRAQSLEDPNKFVDTATFNAFYPAQIVANASKTACRGRCGDNFHLMGITKQKQDVVVAAYKANYANGWGLLLTLWALCRVLINLPGLKIICFILLKNRG